MKEDAVKYYSEHKELGLLKCARNLGISKIALSRWTKACFIEVSKAEKKCKTQQKRQLNVSRVLEILGVSRNGYYAFKNRKPSRRQLKMEKRMAQIRQIHKGSHEIYGAPQIAKKERKVDKLKVMHSDRRIQYTCDVYRETTEGWK